MPIPSQLALITSLTAYPAILRLFSGRNPTAQSLSFAIKNVSTIHSSLITCLATYVLNQTQSKFQQFTHQPNREISATSASSSPSTALDDSTNPAIQIRSELANVITAIECGYLLQDCFALLASARAYARAGKPGTLDKTLLTHHVGIGIALLILQFYIAQGKEKGIYIITQFLLMNSSTPVLNLRWYLRTYRPNWTRCLAIVDVAFAIAFFFARVWLVTKILSDYGRWHGWSSWEAYLYGLRLPCRLGTGALWVANVGWWSILLWNMARRSKKSTLGGH